MRGVILPIIGAAETAAVGVGIDQPMAAFNKLEMDSYSLVELPAMSEQHATSEY